MSRRKKLESNSSIVQIKYGMWLLTNILLIFIMQQFRDIVFVYNSILPTWLIKFSNLTVEYKFNRPDIYL